MQPRSKLSRGLITSANPLCLWRVQAPCQHNFCLGCFNKWVAQGKKSCPTCRSGLPAKFVANPRINTALAGAIRMAKLGDRPQSNKAIEVGRMHALISQTQDIMLLPATA